MSFLNRQRTNFSPGVVFEKMKNWCAYQERSHRETRRKIEAFGLDASMNDELMAKLIEENYLNEERFAVALAGGKFRIKQWGRVKIRVELKKHNISEYLVKRALSQIDETEYLKVMENIMVKKIELAGTKDRRKLYHGVAAHLISRGFESEQVSEKLNELLGELTGSDH